ncbi:MAG: hypothetical protein RRC07_05660, partial [Anaerolineae bacterium]|nr:hypothetical protein [Anaerolineae bacterium]
LWAVDRLRQHSVTSWLIAAAAVAAVILSHNLLALASFALLLAWIGWQCAVGDEGRDLCVLRLGALGAGVALSAFFWLPVALEQDAVNLSTLIGPGGHFDYRNHFLSLTHLLTPPARLDWGASEPAFPLTLGVAQWLLALVGIALLLARRTRQRRHLSFFAVAAIAVLLMMLPVSTPLWEAIPLLAYFQFPWRLLGPIAPLLAVLAGAGADAMASAWRAAGARFLPAALVVLIVVAAFPLLQVPPWPGVPWDTTAAGVLAEELRGRWLGTTSTADFLPATVDIIPRPTEQVLAGIRAGKPPDRVNRFTLPAGTTVRNEALSPLHTRYHISSTEPFPLRLYQFTFPGWVARVDGVAVATEVGRPEGFLVVPLPSGTYRVDVALEATPAQRLAWAVSGVSLLFIGVVAAIIHRRRRAAPPVAAPSPQEVVTNRTVLLVVLAAALLYALLAASAVLHIESTGYRAIPAEHDLFASLSGEIALIGYDAPERVTRGTAIPVTLYWKAQQEVDENYQVFVHLVDGDGALVAQSDKLNPGDFPTRRWPLEKYVRDQHRLALPPDLAPGDYLLSAGLWLQSEQSRLPVLDGEGQVSGDVVPLGTVTVSE